MYPPRGKEQERGAGTQFIDLKTHRIRSGLNYLRHRAAIFVLSSSMNGRRAHQIRKSSLAGDASLGTDPCVPTILPGHLCMQSMYPWEPYHTFGLSLAPVVSSCWHYTNARMIIDHHPHWVCLACDGCCVAKWRVAESSPTVK